jgi:hypothetical protein
VWFSLKRTTSGVAGESSAAGNPGRDDKKERVVERERTVAKG